MNNKTTSQETRDGKKRKKSVQQDNSLSAIFDTGDVTKPSPFWNCFFFLYEVMQHKIPKEVKLKIILAMITKLLICDTDSSEPELNLNLLFCRNVSFHFM